jgi:hypothetical protein
VAGRVVWGRRWAGDAAACPHPRPERAPPCAATTPPDATWRRGGGTCRYGHQPRNAPRRRPMKKGWLVAPKEHWPPYEGGLSMQLAGAASLLPARPTPSPPVALLHCTPSPRLRTPLHRPPSPHPVRPSDPLNSLLRPPPPKFGRPSCTSCGCGSPAGTSKDGRQQFVYVHSSSYASTQAAFEQCQATYDPNTIAALLQVSARRRVCSVFVGARGCGCLPLPESPPHELRRAVHSCALASSWGRWEPAAVSRMCSGQHPLFPRAQRPAGSARPPA